MEINCFKCQTKFAVHEPISRKEECPQCGEDVRCCRNCDFYDPKVYNECKETQADRILDKDRSNLCDFFKLSAGGSKPTASKPAAPSVQSDKEKHRAAAEALFKNFKKS